MAAQLHAIAGRPLSQGPPDLSASIQAAATTLRGLPGRRVLLVLGSAASGPPQITMPSGSLKGIQVVVANLPGPAAAGAWTNWVGAAGASATTLDPALTQLDLASAVNG